MQSYSIIIHFFILLFLTFVNLSLTCIVTANPTLRIRKTPSASSSIVGKLYQGTTISCGEKKNGFCKVGKDKWASSRYINCNTARSKGWETKAPKADYTKKTWRGKTFNQRTIELLQRAEVYMAELGMKKGFKFSFSQDSYTNSYGPSGGTHAGGGAVDIRTSDVNNNKKKVDIMVVALRKAGFAAWSRGRVADGFAKHIHAIAIGDSKASQPAKNQMRSYKRGRNGLRGDGKDPDAYLGRPIPKWAK